MMIVLDSIYCQKKYNREDLKMKQNQTQQNNNQDRPNQSQQSHQLFVPLTEEQQQQVSGGGRRTRDRRYGYYAW